MDITSNISSSRFEYNNIGLRINLLNDRIGTLECLTILHMNLKLRSIADRIKLLTDKFNEAQIADIPLTLVNTNDGLYQIRLARGDKLITGEFITIDDLVKILDPTMASKINNNMSIMEEQLIENSLHVYREISSATTRTHYGKQFSGLVKSKKTEYLYFYTPDKKHTLRFIAEKIELPK